LKEFNRLCGEYAAEAVDRIRGRPRKLNWPFARIVQHCNAMWQTYLAIPGNQLAHIPKPKDAIVRAKEFWLDSKGINSTNPNQDTTTNSTHSAHPESATNQH
jgi:hypothetical protein